MTPTENNSPPSADLGFRWALILVFITGVIGYTLFWRLPPQIPVFFSLPSGKDQLAPGWTLSILPTASIIFLIINWQLSKKIISSSIVMAKLLAWMTGLISLLLLAATINIITLIY
jgi:hypothetical protein